MDHITDEKAKVIRVMQSLIDSGGNVLQANTDNNNVLSVAYECEDKTYFRYISKTCEKIHLFENLAIKKLIYTMIAANDWDNLRLVIEKSLNEEKEVKFAMSLALKLLELKQTDICKSVLSKSIDRNIIFKNQETFLTFIIKNSYPVEVIIEMIKSGLFDVDKPNEYNEKPMRLADERKLNIGEYFSFSQSDLGSLSQGHLTKDKQLYQLEKNNYSEPTYTTHEIPEQLKIFKEISVNTKVKYYISLKNSVLDLFGKVVWTGRDKHKKYYYGIELEKEFNGATDGTFEGRQLFQCKPKCGVLAPIESVVLDNRILEKEKEKTTISEISKSRILALSVTPKDTIDYGIQGNGSSSFLDAMLYGLFAKSDALDYMLLDDYESELDKKSKQLKHHLAFKIIYPLREYKYVSFDKIVELESFIKSYGKKLEEMLKEESNIEILMAFLSKLCPNEQLLSLTTYNNHKTSSMYIQMFVKLSESTQMVTSEELLNFSMVNNRILFNVLPTCLIMYVSEEHREQMTFINFIPLKTIDISQVSLIYFKKCILCDEEAVQQCRKCIEKSKFDISCGFYCRYHKCNHDKMLQLPHLPIKSKCKSEMFLKAILCIEKQKYIAFVKENNFSNSWLRFVNTTSKSDSDEYSYPKVTLSDDLTKFFQQSNEDMTHDYMNYGGSDVRLVLKHSCVLIYLNPTTSCI